MAGNEGSADTSFLNRFEHALEGLDTRLRLLEQGHASNKQLLTSMREDRCNKNEASLKELYDSRNSFRTELSTLGQTIDGLSALCKSMDDLLDKLDKRSEQLDTQINAMESVEQDKKKDTKDYKLLIYGSLFGALLSIVTGVIVFYLTC